MSSRIFFSKIKCTCTCGAFQFNFNFYCFSHFSLSLGLIELICCRLPKLRRTTPRLAMHSLHLPKLRRTTPRLAMHSLHLPKLRRITTSPRHAPAALAEPPTPQRHARHSQPAPNQPFAPFYRVTKLTFRRNIHISAQLSSTFFGSDKDSPTFIAFERPLPD